MFMNNLASNQRESPSARPNAKPHLDTPTRARFFEAIDRRGTATKRSTFKDFNIAPSTGYRLLHERETYGTTADRRSQLRQLKKIETGKGSGRRPKISDEQLQRLLNAPKEVRAQRLQDQLVQAGITHVSQETARRALRDRKDALYRASKAQAITMSPHPSAYTS
ncbi:hypothetical protein yc1106_08350 [Curvularia clavata]|uniref:Uncharacterized protein n=1 Tax=Curvularia clavata TaxID=95742 RepID=A0A9Q8ZFC1_CURCL|nr:hypothetical protein yc1106_08350 [Curvularia clavata]